MSDPGKTIADLHLQNLAQTGAETQPELLQTFRDTIADGDQALKNRFHDGEKIESLVTDRARLIDAVLIHAWQRAGPQADDIELVAVGGYGRGELHPGSDIDIMILLPDSHDNRWHAGIEQFLTFLWDIGLEIGHSVRTIADCVHESAANISVATSLMESRCLLEKNENFSRMRKAVGPDQVWPSQEFFEAKLGEQIARHKRYDDTPYKLEPNVKGSPGGLRDIQMIGWVAKRHFGVETSKELVELGFLSEQEYQRLRAGRQFLWKLRFALHILTGRREDRLLFDHQARIAEMFGYADTKHNLAVEQLMQRYYRTVMELGLLNEMLLQLFREAILMDPQAPATPLNERFHVHNGYLAISGADVFETDPSALLEVFLLLQLNPTLQGVGASTIRQLRLSLHHIDDAYRSEPRHRAMFMNILRNQRFVAHGLQRMNDYGVLGRYLPEFGQIVGRMQYDLFHTYTVDAHTLFVVRNLRGFVLNPPDPIYPQCAQIMQGLAKPELAYLAALFHDIAKGRGGDHSKLGAADAERFCLDHGLSEYEARLVAWLVRNHLILSVTAQKKDIDDPQVIHDFATLVGDEYHLEFLYVLTVADVAGTNPKLWTSWKSSLFEELFLLTRGALRRGLGNPLDKETLIRETQSDTAHLLASSNVGDNAMHKVWDRFPDGYFLRHSPEEIAWHTRLLADHPTEMNTPLVAVDLAGTRGGTSIFVYSPKHKHTFALTTAVLDQLGFNILDARISRTRDGVSVETFRVTETSGEIIADSERADEIAGGISRALSRTDGERPDVTRRASRQVRMFSTPTLIEFNEDTYNRRTIMELTAGDRPGLLSQIGHAFMTQNIVIETAKITTIGERAEDVFYITNANGEPLDRGQCDFLHSELLATLDTP
ncbi:MAG: [protein-PII] uridylyltransferase [Gammaproteobacteria bacterium]|nr:[protein-PII] uridylyltransferase [Gammaproteobacteria bacterium]